MSFLQVIGAPTFTMAQAEEAAKSLKKAMEGFGTDEARIIKEIISHPNGARQLIKQQYQTMYGHKLEEDIEKEISGNFKKGVLALLTPTDEYEAQCIRNAIKGLGTNERACIELICSKEAIEIEILKAAYTRLYKRDLEKDFEHEEGGDLGRIFRSIIQGGRPDSGSVDADLAKKEAEDLYKAGQKKRGTDESEFIRILCSRSFRQLKATFEEYFRISKNDIEKAIKDEMSGNLEKACLAIVKCVRNKSAYFAEQLHESMKGLGTRDDDLIRVLVCRAEGDLAQIKTEYKKLYGKSLYDAVKSELSGDYEKLFLALIEKE